MIPLRKALIERIKVTWCKSVKKIKDMFYIIKGFQGSKTHSENACTPYSASATVNYLFTISVESRKIGIYGNLFHY